MVIEFAEDEEHEDDESEMCVCAYDENGGPVKPTGIFTKKEPTLPVGDPPVISCHLLLEFVDDALNMLRCLQYVTVGLMSRLDTMEDEVPYEDLYEKLRWHAKCYFEYKQAEPPKFVECQETFINSARSLCLFFMEFSRLHTIGSGVFPVYVPPSGRKFFLAGNWKCNGSMETITKLIDALNVADLDKDVDIVVFPSHVYLPHVLGSLTPRIEVGAQNCWRGEGGAFTGEVSADQLVDVGCKWLVVGHAERRYGQGETNTVVALKASYALSLDMHVVVAVGETRAERDQGTTLDVIADQLNAVASKVVDWSRVVLAYEPVWAIGSGQPCTPEEAQRVHFAIREWVRKNFSEEVSSAIRIVYGASVTAATSHVLAEQHDIDGFFVGGAAWDAKEFTAIANSVKVKKNIDFAVEQMMDLKVEPEPSWPEFLESLLKIVS